ncbi:MAG: DUF962 domain-containing protein [Gammaproteobacteria bacterium]|nr:DUF962 domain-containing protein [Gammaproteobacteria bacterium]
MSREYQTFQAFYPYYLSQHSHRVCRRLHFIGSSLVLATTLYSVLTGSWVLLWLLPVLGYGLAWAGHFFFEKNTPATFSYPLLSLAGDWVMFGDMLKGKIKF